MALKINTNIAALDAHSKLQKTDASLNKSLERLSSGLRINRSADDASGLAIANLLKAQASGISQAVRNANDGISVVQIADAALDETLSILDTIKKKAIQAAADGQTLDSRKAIQADIDKLIAEVDDIARTTAFNGLKLLSGQFTNKKFQVGAYSGQTVGVSIDSAESTKIGHLTTAELVVDQAQVGGETRLSVYSSKQNQWIDIQSVKLAYDNSPANSIGALANAINKVAAETGVTAQAIVEAKSVAAVAAGSTGSDFSINGVNIGALNVLANDSNGALVNAINQKTSQHGVVASVDQSGFLTLKSTDGRAIKVTGETGTTLMGSNLTTFGKIKLFQAGANEIRISDDADMVSLNTTTNITTTNDVTTIVDSTIAKNSVLQSATVIQAGSTIGFNLTAANLAAAINTTQDSVILAGSVLGASSVIEANTVLGGTAVNSADVTVATASLLKAGSILQSGAIFTAGTTITTGINTTTGSIAAGTTIAANVTLSGDATLLADMLIQANSVIQSGSSLLAGSKIDADIALQGNMTLTQTMTLRSGSLIGDTGTNILDGSTIGGTFTLAANTSVTRDMLLKTGSIIDSGSTLGKGSTIGGYTQINANATLAGDMTLAAGSILASGSKIKAGTVLTDDIWGAGSILYKAGTVLTGDLTTSGTNTIDKAMTLKANSVLRQGSTLAPTATASTGASATTSIENLERYRLSDINVLSQESAQVAISIVDAAIGAINKIKSDLGSSQNQLTSTIANLSTTKINVMSAESTIRDVDFAEESSNFTKMQILAQAGTFALAQANASSQNVMRLLQ